MGVLKDKAFQSFKTAGLLIDEKIYNPSVHCSYYSCIQLILDIFIEKLNISEGTLEAEARTHMTQNRTGHHNFYINKMRQILPTKGATMIEINNWYNDIFQLKGKREMSDYQRIHCVQGEASLAKGKAKTIRELLEKKFP